MKKTKNIIKKALSTILCMALVLCLVACGSESGSDKKESSKSSGESKKTEESSNVTGSSDASSGNADTGSKKVLVVFFSATGTTKSVAEKIAGITGGDIYEIKAAQEYTDDDLDWNDKKSRTTKEQNDSSARPEIGSDDISLDAYDVIYIGYPIWWGEEPRIMDTFVEKYKFDGKTMIPFCTSSSSGMGRSGKNLEDNAGSGKWLEGKRFGSGASEDDVRDWIEGLQ